MGENTEDNRLPQRLFATDRFPRRRLNIYSRPKILAFLRHVLRGTPEFKKIRESSFGKPFDLPARQCPVSCKLIHCLLTRQLVSDEDYTLWSVFGPDPLRFGLEEFEAITGLNCGDFSEDYEPPDHNQESVNKQKQMHAHKDPFWQKLIGKYSSITIADLADQLENDKEMDGWRRIRLALIIIVDGVLIASQQVHRPTLRYVKMLEDVDVFLAFPWGRESFLHTVRGMKPPKFEKGKPVEKPVDMLVHKLKQETFRLIGFPLAPIEGDYTDCDRNDYDLSPKCFECSTLVKLELDMGIEILLIASIYLPLLKTLVLKSLHVCPNKFQTLLHSLPSLEELSLSVDWEDYAVTVSIACVKTLKIHLTERLNTLSFDTPSLLHFDYSGEVALDYPVVNMEKVVDAKIFLRSEYRRDKYSQAWKLFHGIRKNVANLDLFPDVQYMRSIALDVLSLWSESVPVFNNLKSLAVKSNKEGGILALLRKCPHLETLVFKGVSCTMSVGMFVTAFFGRTKTFHSRVVL